LPSKWQRFPRDEEESASQKGMGEQPSRDRNDFSRKMRKKLAYGYWDGGGGFEEREPGRQSCRQFVGPRSREKGHLLGERGNKETRSRKNILTEKGERLLVYVTREEEREPGDRFISLGNENRIGEKWGASI